MKHCTLTESYHCERWQCHLAGTPTCVPPNEDENETLTSEQTRKREEFQPKHENNRRS